MVSASAGSYVGWYLGAKLGFVTAFMLGVVGLAAGVYFGGRLASWLVE